MKVVLVHDYLREYGGAERVVEAIHEIWPQAPLYTSFVDKKALGIHWQRFAGWDIRMSWVQKNWFVKKCISPLRFLAPKIWESFDLTDYDLVISSSGWFICRGAVSYQPCLADRQVSAVSQKKPLHICYIHHPPRNLYGYATGSDLQKYWLVRVYASIVNFFLRHYDFETAQRVDYFIANSKETARRVEKFYRRESAVIYPPATLRVATRAGPPVEINVSSNTQHATSKKNMTRDTLTHDTKGYFISVGRLTYSKRVDLAIEATYKLKRPLKVVGLGKEEAYLRSIAHENVEFVGSVSDSKLRELYAGAKALIFCALDEDFGMVPVEAMAEGVPVIALGQGGVLETVIDGKTGILFHEPTVDALVGAIKKFERPREDWGDRCREQAQKFSKERFQKDIKAFIESHLWK